MENINDERIKHKRVYTNGVWLHVVERGEGPIVLLIHGFPELWVSWINQIDYLAKHDYRVIVPDLRGYGGSDSPSDPSSYSIFHLVGDLIGLLDDLKVEQAYVVGHDWGAEIAWHLCLFRPERVKALVNLGVPYRPQSLEFKPTEIFTKLFGDDFYITQFQQPKRAEKSFSRYEKLTILKKFILNAPDLLVAPSGVEIIDFLEIPSSLPPWISEEELQFMATQFKNSGFTGPLNYYRAMDLNWELLGPWQGAKVKVPTKLIVGDKDMGYEAFGTKDYIRGQTLRSLVPDLQVVIIDAHHYIQQEKPQLVNDEILSFLRAHALT